MEYITFRRLERYSKKEKDRTDSTYVAKVLGKDLSTNDFTDNYKDKLDAMRAVMQLKGRVDDVGALPQGNNQNGDVYLVGPQGAPNHAEYVWDGQRWEKLGDTVNQVTSYNTLTDKPQINGVELSGNKTLEEIGIEEVSEAKIDSLF